MAFQEIDTETDHGTYKGDPAKTAFEKVNENFRELYPVLSGYSGKNMLLNCGAPIINQRAFSGGALAANTYGYDRWKAGAGGCNVTINAATGLFTHASGPLQQVVELPLLAWGQPLTISVENPSSAISVSVGGSTGTIPAGTGRRGVSLTPSGSGNMVVQLTASGATYSRPQLERGSVATAFDARPPALELALCQSFGELQEGMEYPAAAFAVNDITTYAAFRVRKRATPSVAIRANGSWVGNGAVGTITTLVTGNITPNGFRFDATAFTGSISAGLAYVIRSPIFFIDAEIY